MRFVLRVLTDLLRDTPEVVHQLVEVACDARQLGHDVAVAEGIVADAALADLGGNVAEAPQAETNADSDQQGNDGQHQIDCRGNADLAPVKVTIQQSGQEVPVIEVETQRGTTRERTHLTLEFCASPEFEEARRLTANLADAGRPPFAVVSGEQRIEMPSLPSAVRHIMANARKGLEIQRYKGLGEMNPEQLWATTMNPDTSTLLQVKVEDLPEADVIFSMLMGDAVEPRRKFIEDHALSVKNLDI